jgi:hypothetical protein
MEWLRDELFEVFGVSCELGGRPYSGALLQRWDTYPPQNIVTYRKQRLVKCTSPMAKAKPSATDWVHKTHY